MYVLLGFGAGGSVGEKNDKHPMQSRSHRLNRRHGPIVIRMLTRWDAPERRGGPPDDVTNVATEPLGGADRVSGLHRMHHTQTGGMHTHFQLSP